MAFPPLDRIARRVRTIGMCSLDARSEGQYGCVPGRRATGRLIFGSVDPEDNHFRRSSRFIRFHSPNNMDQQIDTIA